MNINVRHTAHNDVDPFSISAREPLGRNAGKGDRDRSDLNTFKRNFPTSMGPTVVGKTRKIRITYLNGKKVEKQLV
jgi:hypothetical protein